MLIEDHPFGSTTQRFRRKLTARRLIFFYHCARHPLQQEIQSKTHNILTDTNTT